MPDFDFNYGWGDRIQLKYELPIALHEDRPTVGPAPPQAGSPGAPATSAGERVLGGLGNSLLGIKWRFFEHRVPPLTTAGAAASSEPPANFSVSTYPQLSLSNPTRAVSRGIVAPGPQFLLPLEINGRLGPLRLDAEVGYWFTNHQVAQSWIRGLLVGHEFSDRTELYLELYDQQDATRVNGQRKARELTLGTGGRQALNRRKSLLALFMGGRSLQAISANNTEPSWIAYAGLQLLLGPRPPEASVDPKLPRQP